MNPLARLESKTYETLPYFHCKQEAYFYFFDLGYTLIVLGDLSEKGVFENFRYTMACAYFST